MKHKCAFQLSDKKKWLIKKKKRKKEKERDKYMTKTVEKSTMATDFCESIIHFTFLSSQYWPWEPSV